MIVVTTPTGQIGAQVLTGLLDAPGTAPAVRVIARDPARLPADVRARVEVVAGSHAHPAVLKEACAGADRVFWLVPPTPGAASVDGHFRDFTEPLRDVVGGDGIRRVVGVSTLGRGVAENAGQISASLAMDETIAAMDVYYRALCPPFLMENLLHQVEAIRRTGMFFLATTEDRILRTCATGDVAATAVRLLLDDAWTGTEDVPLVGPDDLTPLGMAEVLSEVLGRPIRFRRTSSAEYRASLVGFGASEAWARGLADMVDSLDAQGYYGADAASTPEAAPTTFRRWCEEVLRPAVVA
ncbi:NmrA family transcriptional regulator [Embleya scabrispora]|uniref:NmrA family transcriptional regulator n=1 Tax=Embleya scabrispora TaxID=159449 RepID=A0A1T3NUP5_9ACTN|nr:NAD(P)H-binding protein [Embleya scabrispora]OPC80524.1 NmrA family transcriptional regulator [Embleya scabrispora]